MTSIVIIKKINKQQSEQKIRNFHFANFFISNDNFSYLDPHPLSLSCPEPYSFNYRS